MALWSKLLQIKYLTKIKIENIIKDRLYVKWSINLDRVYCYVIKTVAMVIDSFYNFIHNSKTIVN